METTRRILLKTTAMILPGAHLLGAVQRQAAAFGAALPEESRHVLKVAADVHSLESFVAELGDLLKADLWCETEQEHKTLCELLGRFFAEPDDFIRIEQIPNGTKNELLLGLFPAPPCYVLLELLKKAKRG